MQSLQPPTQAELFSRARKLISDIQHRVNASLALIDNEGDVIGMTNAITASNGIGIGIGVHNDGSGSGNGEGGKDRDSFGDFDDDGNEMKRKNRPALIAPRGNRDTLVGKIERGANGNMMFDPSKGWRSFDAVDEEDDPFAEMEEEEKEEKEKGDSNGNVLSEYNNNVNNGSGNVNGGGGGGSVVDKSVFGDIGVEWENGLKRKADLYNANGGRKGDNARASSGVPEYYYSVRQLALQKMLQEAKRSQKSK